MKLDLSLWFRSGGTMYYTKLNQLYNQKRAKVQNTFASHGY